MRIISVLLLIFITACGSNTQKTHTSAADNTANGTTKQQSSNPVADMATSNTAYHISTTHVPYMVTGFFNTDTLLDTAVLVRHKTTGKDALLIKHAGTGNTYLLRTGKDVGFDFEDFNWVGQFEVIKKGTKIWSNVVDGEIVGEDQVPENRKMLLQTDAILIHEDEGGGGGIIYFENGKYVWVQ